MKSPYISSTNIRELVTLRRRVLKLDAVCSAQQTKIEKLEISKAAETAKAASALASKLCAVSEKQDYERQLKSSKKSIKKHLLMLSNLKKQHRKQKIIIAGRLRSIQSHAASLSISSPQADHLLSLITSLRADIHDPTSLLEETEKWIVPKSKHDEKEQNPEDKSVIRDYKRIASVCEEQKKEMTVLYSRLSKSESAREKAEEECEKLQSKLEKANEIRDKEKMKYINIIKELQKTIIASKASEYSQACQPPIQQTISQPIRPIEDDISTPSIDPIFASPISTPSYSHSILTQDQYFTDFIDSNKIIGDSLSRKEKKGANQTEEEEEQVVRDRKSTAHTRKNNPKSSIVSSISSKKTKKKVRSGDKKRSLESKDHKHVVESFHIDEFSPSTQTELRQLDKDIEELTRKLGNTLSMDCGEEIG
ncbi:hypothetical protein ADUPG1_014122 [Aduncisulcus paluster]|uniref:Uncharacterized protein n=1 Tax=Aduncisulcus paluster TaxID=2918883 RepID=A0ABQ5KAU1_9EUKA|nr:hypothetical protein ADUPG1_014122 [Aduncisulcus paluster]